MFLFQIHRRVCKLNIQDNNIIFIHLGQLFNYNFSKKGMQTIAFHVCSYKFVLIAKVG